MFIHLAIFKILFFNAIYGLLTKLLFYMNLLDISFSQHIQAKVHQFQQWYNSLCSESHLHQRRKKTRRC